MTFTVCHGKIHHFFNGKSPFSMGKSPFLIGKPSISMKHLSHGYVTNNQRVIFRIQYMIELQETSCLKNSTRKQRRIYQREMRSYHDLPTIRHTIQQTLGFTIVYHYQSVRRKWSLQIKCWCWFYQMKSRLNGG